MEGPNGEMVRVDGTAYTLVPKEDLSRTGELLATASGCTQTAYLGRSLLYSGSGSGTWVAAAYASLELSWSCEAVAWDHELHEDDIWWRLRDERSYVTTGGTKTTSWLDDYCGDADDYRARFNVNGWWQNQYAFVACP